MKMKRNREQGTRRALKQLGRRDREKKEERVSGEWGVVEEEADQSMTSGRPSPRRALDLKSCHRRSFSAARRSPAAMSAGAAAPGRSALFERTASGTPRSSSSTSIPPAYKTLYTIHTHILLPLPLQSGPTWYWYSVENQKFNSV